MDNLTTPTQEEIEAVAKAMYEAHVDRQLLFESFDSWTVLSQMAEDAWKLRAADAVEAISALGWQRVPEGCVIIEKSRLAILEFSNMRIGVADTAKLTPISEASVPSASSETGSAPAGSNPSDDQ